MSYRVTYLGNERGNKMNIMNGGQAICQKFPNVEQMMNIRLRKMLAGKAHTASSDRTWVFFVLLFRDVNHISVFTVMLKP